MSVKVSSKVVLTIIFLLLFGFCFSLTAQAEQLYYDGQWHEYYADPTYLKINGENVNTDVPPVIFNDRSVVPARAVFEKLGANVNWDGIESSVGIAMNNTQIKLKINDNIALVNGEQCQMDIPAKIINDRTMIPARFIAETLGFDVGWVGNQRIITIDSPQINIEDISIKESDNNFRITVTSDNEIADYSTFELDNHPRLVLDIKNALLNFDKKEIQTNNTNIYSIRTSQYEINPYSTRIVVDLNNWDEYKISLSDNEKELYIDFDTEKSFINDISYTAKSSYDKIELEMENVKSPNVFRLTNPNRIVLDFSGTTLNISEMKEETKKLNFVTSIRYGQFNEDTTRVVLDVEGQPSYSIKKDDDEIRIDVEDPTIRNFYYENSDKPKFIIESTAVDQNFNESLIDGNTYIVSVPRSSADFGEGKLLINDGSFEYVEIIKNKDTNNTDFIFKSVTPHKYTINKSGDRTIIEADKGTMIIKDETYTDVDLNFDFDHIKIVLDAGHGGKDPGATYGSLKEKDLNLNIVLKLYDMLKNAGVNVYLTRDTDVFVPLSDRAEYANNLKADLFVSVHNNAMSEPDYDGTMTLYYGPNRISGFNITSKAFASIIQKEMVSHLGTTDRGLRERPNLVVLNKTKMPAILAEVAFMTNERDRNNLSDEDFRQRAAESLYVGIIKALKQQCK